MQRLIFTTNLPDDQEDIEQDILEQDLLEQDLSERDVDTKPEQDDRQIGCWRPSAYVRAFEDMINTVAEHEFHLLSDEERKVFGRIRGLSYSTRYCLSRLILRKYQWHPISSLENYKREVGDTGLKISISDLCQPLATFDESDIKEEDMVVDNDVKEDVREVIDLTVGSQDEAGSSNQTFCDAPKLQPVALSYIDEVIGEIFEENTEGYTLEYLCEDESHMSLQEILERLGMTQLKRLAKETKIKVSRLTKPAIISALINSACNQSILDFPSTSKSKGKAALAENGLRQTTLSFPPKTNANRSKLIPKQTQEQRLRGMALNLIGKCIRVNQYFHRLIRRLHIIAYRSTEYPTSLLLPALLTSFKKRNYAEYSHSRDGSIWEAREDFLDFEKALELEAKIDQLTSELDAEARTKAKTSASKHIISRARVASSVPTDQNARESSKEEEFEENPAPDVQEHAKESIQDQKAWMVIEIFDRWIKPGWDKFISAKLEELSAQRTPGLERFEPGYVYTRLVCKALDAFHSLKEHQSELEVLQVLLSQRFWRRGKRAKWYDRRALIQTKYLCLCEDGKTKDMKLLRTAMEGIIEALNDKDTGIVLRPCLVRRLRKLEEQLKIPPEERSYIEGKLKKAECVYVSAVRIAHRAGSLGLDTNGRPLKENPQARPTIHSYLTTMNAIERPVEKLENPTKGRAKGKSIWRGLDHEEVNVETRALQYYESQGFKGFHSETRILTTLFGLLFWDIIFSDVPGAFETPFQVAPLDITEDSFYLARKDAIERRLEELEEGKAREILENHDDLHREQGTWCVGVRWDICGKEDLIEIIECLGGKTLAIISRLFCEDYGARSSGVPDLIIWNVKDLCCKFVEVKGPGDTPQENQKLWFDSLLGANAFVEICHVYDETKPPRKALLQSRKSESSSKPKRKRKANAMAEDEHLSGIEEDNEVDYDQLDPSQSGNPQRQESPNKRRRMGDSTAADEMATSTFYPPPVLLHHAQPLLPGQTSS